MLDHYIPGLVAHIDASVPPDELLIGVDEQTALVGDGERWRVVGEGSVHIRDGADWRHHNAGESVTVDALH
jgi:cyanophycinase-like exopeptidase